MQGFSKMGVIRTSLEMNPRINNIMLVKDTLCIYTVGTFDIIS